MHVIIDTNVLIVANDRNCEQATRPCILNCIRRLEQIRQHGIVVIDKQWRILKEYKDNVHETGQPGVGDAFLKWVLINQANTRYCEQVPITPTADGSFTEFPNDSALAGFDLSDRKFVAVALVHEAKPPILNAVDTDWRNFQEPLKQAGVMVEFLCPELLRQP